MYKLRCVKRHGFGIEVWKSVNLFTVAKGSVNMSGMKNTIIVLSRVVRVWRIMKNVKRTIFNTNIEK